MIRFYRYRYTLTNLTLIIQPHDKPRMAVAEVS